MSTRGQIQTAYRRWSASVIPTGLNAGQRKGVWKTIKQQNLCKVRHLP